MILINLELPEQYENYGYSWNEMVLLTYDMACRFYYLGAPIYRVYRDNTEALANNREELLVHCEDDGLFGIELNDLFRIILTNRDISLKNIPTYVDEFIAMRKACLEVLDQMEEVRQCCVDTPAAYSDEEVLSKCIDIVEQASTSVVGMESIKNAALPLMRACKTSYLSKGYPLIEHAVRVMCAHFATEAGFKDRCAWTDYLKQMDSNYKRRLDNGTFHI